jgi:uncharacterized protein YndB with AHSA1/START domain
MKINVIQSAVIDAPIDRVWAVLRDFNSQDRWHPAVARSRMENDVGGDVVGGVRASSTRPYLYLTTWPRFASSR